MSDVVTDPVGGGSEPPAGVVVIRGDDVDIETIQTAIRARVATRDAGRLHIGDAAVADASAERLRPLADWNLPRDIWDAMHPPNLRPWNLEEDFPVASHRTSGVAGLLIWTKKMSRSILRVIGRPLLAQQVEINRTLSLMTRALASELACERIRTRALEQRIARIGSAMREIKGDAQPLVVFADEEESVER